MSGVCEASWETPTGHPLSTPPPTQRGTATRTVSPYRSFIVDSYQISPRWACSAAFSRLQALTTLWGFNLGGAMLSGQTELRDQATGHSLGKLGEGFSTVHFSPDEQLVVAAEAGGLQIFTLPLRRDWGWLILYGVMLPGMILGLAALMGRYAHQPLHWPVLRPSRTAPTA